MSAKTRNLREQLVADYTTLVRRVARSVASRLPRGVDIDDLVSYGFVGLMDAIEKFDPTRNNKFKTYAEFRIKGAILDELRTQDWVPRSVRIAERRLAEARSNFRCETGRDPDEEELAKSMSMTLAELQVQRRNTERALLISYDGGGTDDGYSMSETLSGESFEEKVERVDSEIKQERLEEVMRQGIQDNMETLGQKQKLILSLRYMEGMTFKEIGEILDVSESRVSKIHVDAVEVVRKAITASVLKLRNDIQSEERAAC